MALRTTYGVLVERPRYALEVTMMTRRCALLLQVSVGSLIACSSSHSNQSSPSVADAGGKPDASRPYDAGFMPFPPDASSQTPDSGEAIDARTMVDSGEPGNAGTTTLDAGRTAPDASGTVACGFDGGSLPYVKPGTQGYRGATSALTTYSAANGEVPAGTTCAWGSAGLRCDDTDLTLDHVYVRGSIYWTGCGSLKITDSIIDWKPSTLWDGIQAACQKPNASATITATNSTLETDPQATPYSGGSDVGPIDEYSGEVPMFISNCLIQGYPQGVDPGSNSVIHDNEIYVPEAVCDLGTYHCDGLFSQGGNNITYEGNYIVVGQDSTAAIFFQSSPNSTGNKVIGNFIQGGSYALYNENSNGLVVINNTFGGYHYGDCDLRTGASWGMWCGNVDANGQTVTPQAAGCN